MKLKQKYAGLVLRVGLGVFMLFWGLAKLLTPNIWLNSFQALYGASASSMLLFIGVLQVAIAGLLFVGWKTRLAAAAGVGVYLVMLVPGLGRILQPFGITAGVPNLLFYEKILVIASFLALYIIGPGAYSVDESK